MNRSLVPAAAGRTAEIEYPALEHPRNKSVPSHPVELAKVCSVEASVWDSPCPAAPYPFGARVVCSSWSRLWTIGNRALLDAPLLGLFCSRQCTGEAIVCLYDLARALRDAGVSVVSGFHSPMEQECLNLLLRGTQPIVVCPARSLERPRLPRAWRTSIEQGRLLVLSPFPPDATRTTQKLTEARNLLVSELATTLFIAHAAPGSHTETIRHTLEASGKTVLGFQATTTVTVNAIQSDLQAATVRADSH